MTHPLSAAELQASEGGHPYLITHDGFLVDLTDVMVRHDRVAFYRHPNGGGFVAENSYVPLHIQIPWNVTVFEGTIVFDNADLASAGTRICGNVSRVSRVAHQEDLLLIERAAKERMARRTAWNRAGY